MRFFLEFVSCCGSPRSQEEAPSPAPEGSRTEETRALVGQKTTTHARANNISYNNNDRNSCSNNNNNNEGRRKKKRRGQVGNRSDEWKPSLGPISEHIVAAAAAEEAAGKRVAKRRGGESGGNKKSSRDMANIAALYEESRDSSFGGSVMPTFSGYSFLM